MSQLTLIRHGESVWNLKNVFTGWVDVPLSHDGIKEAIKAGEELADKQFDVVYTSVQVRAIETTMIALAQSKSDKTPVIIHKEGKMKEWTGIYDEEMAQNIIPVHCEIDLNERYYGELQGKNKEKTAEEVGEEQVHKWRRSYDIPPPNGECLKDTAARTIPFFTKNILPQLEAGKNILVSAHGNSLRSIIMNIEDLSKEQVSNLELPTGKPIYYNFKNGKLEKANSELNTAANK